MIIEPSYTPPSRRIAIIYDACRKEEIEYGRLLAAWEFPPWDRQLGHLGISLTECLQVCLSAFPSPNVKTLWENNDTVINRLREYAPTILLCVGSPAYVFGRYGPNCAAHAHDSIFDWRGSLWWSDWLQCKGMAIVHPGHMTRGGTRPMLEGHYWAYQHFDLTRFITETGSTELTLPEHKVDILYDFASACDALRRLRQERCMVAFDIEGGVRGITCYSFAIDGDNERPTVIPFSRINGTAVFTAEEETVLWQLTKEWLEDPACSKVLQNYLYDAFVLAWTLGIHIRGLAHDTMLMFWELHPELEKSLELQTSILTRVPFYKGERKSADDTVAFTYCGKDSAVTLECCRTMIGLLDDLALRQGTEQTCWDHYRLNLRCLAPSLYMSLRGFRFDTAAVAKRIKEHREEMDQLQGAINLSSGREALSNIWDSDWILKNVVTPKLCRAVRKEKRPIDEVPMEYVRDFFGGTAWKAVTGNKQRKSVVVQAEIKNWDDAVKWAKPSAKGKILFLRKLYQQSVLTAIDFVRASVAMGIHVNIQSPKDVKQYLYEDCGFEPVYAKKGSSYTDRVSTDVGALLDIFRKTRGDERIKNLLRYRKLAKEFSYLTTEIDDDGFLRAGLNVVGTNTGRFASYASPTGKGNIQMQNVGKRVRTLLLPPEPGQVINQADLAGADSWTVAAHAASHKDPTMLDDIRERLKIQSVLALIYTKGEAVNKLSRADLKALCKGVDENGWLYAAAKQVLYGSSYGMGPLTMSEHIMKTSYKKGGEPVFVPSSECKGIQDKAFFVRYPGVKEWQEWWANRILAGVTELPTSFGHTHTFWGHRIDRNAGNTRKANPQMLNHVLSIEPQLVTTYCTKLAMLRMWEDPSNRRPDGTLVCEPLMTVHDSLVSASPRELADWTKAKHDEWFNNRVKVAGITMLIPYGFGRGDNWGLA